MDSPKLHQEELKGKGQGAKSEGQGAKGKGRRTSGTPALLFALFAPCSLPLALCPLPPSVDNLRRIHHSVHLILVLGKPRAAARQHQVYHLHLSVVLAVSQPL